MTLLSGFKNLLATPKPCDEDELTDIAPIAAPAVEAALDTESSPAEPDPLLETTRHLLRVATAILVLLALYTFYISSPVLIPLTLAVLITMLLAP